MTARVLVPLDVSAASESILPALRSIDPRLREAAMVLGATPAQTWRAVDLPIGLQVGACSSPR